MLPSRYTLSMGGLLERSETYRLYLKRFWQVIPVGDCQRLADWAYSDSQKCVELYPSWNYAIIIHALNEIQHSRASSNSIGCQSAVKRMDALLERWRPSELTDFERCFAINCRAQGYHFLNDLEKAKASFAESIQLDPSEPRWYVGPRPVLGRYRKA